MSVVHTNGYRLAPGTDPFAFIATLRTVMDPIRDRLDAQALMERAVVVVDLADRKGEPRPDLPLLEAMHAIDAEQDSRSAKPDQHGYDPHRFEVAFARVSSGSLLALLYTEESDFVDAWRALPEVSEYILDTRSGPNDEIECERREADWGEVMPGHAPPVLRTLGWKLRTSPRYDTSNMALVMGRNEPETRALLEAQGPTRQQRARQVVIDLIGAELHRRDPAADILRDLMPHLMRTPADVIDLAEPLLHDEVVSYAIDGTGPIGPNGALAKARARGEQTPTRPLDLSTVEAAVVDYLDRFANEKD